MVENNEIKEMKYTEEQVMNALLQLQPEERAFLYGVNIANIMELANDTHLPRAMGATAFGSPTVLVKELSIAGK